MALRENRLQRNPRDLRELNRREEIFRVTGAVESDSAVDAWFGDGQVELRAMALEWFGLMRRCGDDVGVLIHDGCPVACVEDAPFGYANTFKSHVNIGFFRGASLADPAGLLKGGGKRMRHVKLYPGRPLNVAALGALIHAAYTEIKARLTE